MKFTATHQITWNGRVIPVLLFHHCAFTETEWENAEQADWTFDEYGLRFQGGVPHGTSMIERLPPPSAGSRICARCGGTYSELPGGGKTKCVRGCEGNRERGHPEYCDD